jgi:hypothetical protein
MIASIPDLHRYIEEHAAGQLSNEPRPEWQANGIPCCSESCPHHDGKRCAALGVRAPAICEPCVEEMFDKLRILNGL